MHKKLEKQKKYLIIISGPTASGKSSLALDLALRYNTSIISADSRQIYKYMDIGTSKPTKEERQMLTHHLIDILEPGEFFSAGKFQQIADEIIAGELKQGNISILCGGTAFYIESLINGLDNFPEIPENILIQLEADLLEKGLLFLSKELKSVDPELAKKTDLQNPRRVLRALSVARHTGNPPSSYMIKKKKKLNYSPIFILLMPERKKLYSAINQRVDQMMKNGLVEEAKYIFENYPGQAQITVGYAEFEDYFKGEIKLEEAVELVKRNTRRYAKRQLSWFRSKEEWNVFQPEDRAGILSFLQKNVIEPNR